MSTSEGTQPAGGGWSWNQYAIFRVLLGSYLVVHFVHLLPWGVELFSNRGMLANAAHSPLIGVFPNLLAWLDSPFAVTTLLIGGVGGSFMLTIGRWDRIAAVGLWLLLASLFGRNPLIANPSLPVVGWMLLFHACMPARSNAQSGSDGRVPKYFFGLAWLLLAIAYSYSGWTKLFSDAWVQGETVRWVLENPLARDTWLREWLLATPPWLLESVTQVILYVELLFAPLALIGRLRVWLWGIMLVVQLGFLVLLNFADLTTPMLLLHLLTFEPRWLRERAFDQKATLLFDGECGFCHGWVRFVMQEDRASVFAFQPMQLATQANAASERADFDSMIVEIDDGQQLEKFIAAKFILSRLPGLWRLLAVLMQIVPAFVGDRVYSFIARHRRRLAPKPATLCPILPPPGERS
jgi:predicted DCC family thiol-disulfide oxidoreductase YuxK